MIGVPEIPDSLVKRMQRLAPNLRLGWNPVDNVFALVVVAPTRSWNEETSIRGCRFPREWKLWGGRGDPLFDVEVYMTDFQKSEIEDRSFLQKTKEWLRPFDVRNKEEVETRVKQFDYDTADGLGESCEIIESKERQRTWPEITSYSDTTEHDKFVLEGGKSETLDEEHKKAIEAPIVKTDKGFM